MATTEECYSEAILFMLDSISPTQRIQLKDDLRLKLDRAYELQPSTLQGLEDFEGSNESQPDEQDYPMSHL